MMSVQVAKEIMTSHLSQQMHSKQQSHVVHQLFWFSPCHKRHIDVKLSLHHVSHQRGGFLSLELLVMWHSVMWWSGPFMMWAQCVEISLDVRLAFVANNVSTGQFDIKRMSNAKLIKNMIVTHCFCRKMEMFVWLILFWTTSQFFLNVLCFFRGPVWLVTFDWSCKDNSDGQKNRIFHKWEWHPYYHY